MKPDKLNKAVEGHTPGPWKLETDWPPREDDEQARGRFIITADSSYLCEVEDCYTASEHEEQLANARLIASAPDLLAENTRLREALSELVRLCWDADTVTESEWESGRDKARAALRREGKGES